MEEPAETALAGGAQTEGLVRVGRTTRRPPHHRAAYVDALLQHLTDVGFTGAPRPLGHDDHGRQVLTYVEGEVLHTGPYRLSEARIRSATVMIRAYHDATATSALRADQEVVCHGDLGPHNTVFRGNKAVALIDFDADTGPGSHLEDFAHAVWCFADLTDAGIDLAEQARKTRLMCDTYGDIRPAAVVEALIARFRRARAQHSTAGRPGGVQVFDGLLRWLATFGGGIAAS